MTFFGMICFSQCSGAVCQALGGEFKGGREEEGREGWREGERERERGRKKRGGGEEREREKERKREGGRERERKRGIEHSMYVRD